MEKTDKIKKAFEIAKKNLQACYFEKGVLASKNHYSDFWARDSFWALNGILAIGDVDKAKSIFDLFLSYQKKNGKIPRKIMLEYAFLKYVFKTKTKRRKPKSIYRGLIPPFHSMDDNFLMIIAFGKYLKKTQDKKFIKKNYNKIKKAIGWYEGKKSKGLIKEYLLSGWMDTVFKTGRVLYTNALYYRALKSVGEIAQYLGNDKDSKYYFKESEKVKVKIRKEFWSGNFYSSQSGDKKRFDTVGSILSVLYGISSKEENKKIIKKLKKIKTGKLLPMVSPKYSRWKVNPLTYLFGISDYHNGASWLWVDLLEVALEHREGYKKLALKNMEKISEIILRDGIVCEIYNNDGSAYKRLLWGNAKPFAWNSGIFLSVFDDIFKDYETID